MAASIDFGDSVVHCCCPAVSGGRSRSFIGLPNVSGGQVSSRYKLTVLERSNAQMTSWRGRIAAERMRLVGSYGAKEHYLCYNLQDKPHTEYSSQPSLQCMDSAPQVLLGIEEALSSSLNYLLQQVSMLLCYIRLSPHHKSLRK